jgi:hypothetical protein
MQFETLYQDLALGAEIIRQLVSGVSPEEARARPAPESWSILEVICHLYDEEIEDFRQHLEHILHHPGDSWPPIDPQGWIMARGYNERDLGVMLGKFLAERSRSLEWLRSLAASDWDVEYSSPFGAMKAGDMLSSWVAHDNLHTRQLVELRRARIERISQPYDIRYAGDW